MLIDSAPVPCPVGYYPSPWLANLYLQDFDWFVEQDLYKTRRGKRIKYVRHYLRYTDDILLMGTSKSDLKKAVRAIAAYLGQIGLQIKPEWEIKAIGRHAVIDGKWQLKPDTYWCDIGGYKFSREAVILRDAIFLEGRRLAKNMAKQGYYTPHQCRGITSKVGWARHADSYNYLENDIRPYVNLKRARGIIGDVDKKRKCGNDSAGGSRKERKPCHCAEEHATGTSRGGGPSAL